MARGSMHRQALNKFNAPEVLGALFSALEVADLHGAVVDLKRIGVPRIVNDAWARRGEHQMDVTAMTQNVADQWATRQKFAGLVEDYIGKKARLVAMARKDILDLVRQRPHFYEVQPVTTGLIRELFNGTVPALRDIDLAKLLWNLWENRGPSQSTGEEIRSLATKYGRILANGGQGLDKLQTAAFSIALLRSTRQPNLAKYVEALFTKHLAKELAENAPQVATGAPPSPGVLFMDLYVTGQPAARFVQNLKVRAEGNPDKARALAAALLSEVNWHSLARNVGGDPNLLDETDGIALQNIVPKIHYGVVEAAGIAVGLLLSAGDRRTAKVVADTVVRDFTNDLVQNSMVG